ncbi:NAD(P)H-quinone oxidoreductase [Corynebacterium sp.]|uniref:NAD(P)H-quinone oxidoreductase n=1 Tax=Corynebacterium sp. TaxID=1720 RepID=UPI0026DBFD97|nr:NAD(P)H-quinone oxidoreductase [Corynebacterium sp.]MDO4609589.1 NAD(P)H-quinone oxidoreductase [Corynebacterium sp.]
MKAIIQTDPENPRSLEWTETDTPVPGEGEVLVRVTASAVNRADILQARGHYPPPAGESGILGLECAGVIEEIPEGVGAGGWQVGDEVLCLLAGGGYAEYVAVPVGQMMAVPEGLTPQEAVALPEVACTTWSNLVMVAGLQMGDVVLIHGGAGGIGTFAIQLCKRLGATVAVTAGSAAKLERCRELGADILINYREEEFEEVMAERGGADVILDIMGAKYLDRNVKALAKDGRLVIIGLQGGVKGDLTIARLLNKRGSIHATGLRYRDRADKARIVADTEDNVWPMVAEGLIRPTVHETMPLAEAARAHELLDSGEVTGKIVLVP